MALKINSVTVCGSLRKTGLENLKIQAEEIASLLVDLKLSLITGSGEGVSKLIVDEYRKQGGKNYTAYLPLPQIMQKVGEQVGPKPDKIHQINGDYPERNLQMIKNSEAIIVIGGNIGTLQEVIFAVNDYQLPVFALADSGPVCSHILAIDKLRESVKFFSTINQLNILLKSI